jgi:alpha-glucosidase
MPRIYGLGEKMGRLERSGRVWDMWNTDEPEHTPTRDPLYVSIPFAMISVGERWFGLFVDNPARQYWNAGVGSPHSLTIDVEDDYLDIYLMQGGSPREVLGQYNSLTGSTPLPPLWALGYHQSRYSYAPQSEVRRIAREFRSKELPADVIQFDIDYMNGYRIFTWDRTGFPDPTELMSELRQSGFKVITIVDPGIKVDPEYSVYTEGAAKDYFCKLPDGTRYQGAVWPGKAVYPDFSRQEVRIWWAEQHRELFKHGVSGIWNDMNEPADFTGDAEYRPDYTVPNELQAVTDTGTPVSFARFHNLYAAGMNSATREGFARHAPDKRGFLITRSGYAGLQRSAGVWTGDNCSWWEHLDAAVPMLLGLSISGVSMVGSDTGGFQEDASAQLYARWFSFSAFTPYFRSHTANDTRAHEPRSFGTNVLNISRHYLQLRYALLPYLYTAFYRAETEAEPVMKPLFFEWPEDQRLKELNDEYLFGGGLLVAPVTSADTLWRHVYLPEGLWYDFWDDHLYRGGSDQLIHAPIGKLPLCVRGGSVIPHERPRLHTDVERKGDLLLEVYPDDKGQAKGELYSDAEEGWGYRSGEYSLIAFTYQKGILEIKFESAGYSPVWSHARVRVHRGSGPGQQHTAKDRSSAEQSADPLRLSKVALPEAFAGRGAEHSEVRVPLQNGRWEI